MALYFRMAHTDLPPWTPSIKEHAIIGDLHTIALVDIRGTIDLMCLPRIDGPSVFAALLDPDAGYFSVDVEIANPRRRQIYVPDTNVLISGFHGTDAVVELTDFMAIGQDVGEPLLVRKLESVRGDVTVSVRCAPRFNYARSAHVTQPSGEGIDFVAADAASAMRLIANIPLQVDADTAIARVALRPKEPCFFVLGSSRDGLPEKQSDIAEFAQAKLDATVSYWRTWTSKSTYRGRWRGPVTRSILALKLLTSEEHGSMAAAATFGLPEVAGGERNWDYRYSWIRDASFATYAFIRLGYTEEAVAFMHWIGRCMNRSRTDGPMRPFYRIDGSGDIGEEVLENFAGYRDSRPVLIGNAASEQLQLDVYGALMDAVYLTSKYGGAMSLAAWEFVTYHTEWLCSHWREADEGIWESRNGKRHYLHSRVMCWVAVDRAIRLAQKRSLPAPLPRWNEVRSDIHRSILADFWNPELQAFVRSQGESRVDASALMMPLVRFISAKDPRWTMTLQRIEEHLTQGALVYRYDTGEQVDGMRGTEGAFTTCSFWMVECLARAGDVVRAELLFEKIMSYGNHVGLFSEEIEAGGEQLGNFPQALTHLALISAAVALDRALSHNAETTWQ
jgi:GH15 family glucan-1,4-alpha-glucosidase